jgi:hypothetical protein
MTLVPEPYPRVARVRSAIPDILNPIGYEVRLSDDPRVDFGGAISWPQCAKLAAIGRSDSAFPHLASHEVWRTLAAFADAWGDASRALDRYVPFIGFEFDLDEGPASVPVPSVFAMFDWPIGVDPVNDARRVEHTAISVLDLLLGAHLSDGTRRNIAGCFRNLPARARIISAGAMLGRSVDAARIFACVPPVDVPAYLSSVGWPGDRDAVARFVAESRSHHTNGVVQFQIDVGPVVGERMGVEFSYMGRPDAAARWIALLDWIVAAGLCRPWKRDALLAWPGIVTAGGPAFRDVSHVKVVLGGGRPVEAKAYLSMTPMTSPR